MITAQQFRAVTGSFACRMSSLSWAPCTGTITLSCSRPPDTSHDLAWLCSMTSLLLTALSLTMTCYLVMTLCTGPACMPGLQAGTQLTMEEEFMNTDRTSGQVRRLLLLLSGM